MENNAKAKALSFLKEYKLGEVTVDILTGILEKQGYQLVEYNNIQNNANVSALIKALGIERNIEQSKGFTYADDKRRIVFLHEDLSQTEKLMVLAHEEGHIYCNHLSSAPILGREVIEEHEASEFAHYLLYQGMSQKMRHSIRSHKKALTACVIALLVIAIGLAVIGGVQKERSYYGEYYLTSTGNKYHKEDCIFVKDKTTCHRMTNEEFESGNYEPCGMCLPE